MRYLVTAAAAALMSASAAQAVVVDLTYTVEAEVTGHSYYVEDGLYGDEPPTYQGPSAGAVVTLGFSIVADTDEPSMNLDVSEFYDLFDPMTGSLQYTDIGTYFFLNQNGTGKAQEYTQFDDDGRHFQTVKYDVLAWSVEGLPEITPVPLPASFPLLALGIWGIFALRKRV